VVSRQVNKGNPLPTGAEISNLYEKYDKDSINPAQFYPYGKVYLIFYYFYRRLWYVEHVFSL